ncbi:MAG: amidohydrolase [Candidatus Aenigmarchaeota archaeon]|nr:amidohydrolase [Candidatus Aenigmarchaeota archaeon]
MALFRGISDDKNLHEWLTQDIIPKEKKIDKNLAYHGSMLSIMESISTGTTSFVEMYSHTEAIIKAVNESGIRSFISCGLRDNNNIENTDDEIKKAENLLKKIEKNKNELINPVLSLHWSLTCSDDLIKKIGNIGNLPVFMHVSETQKEVDENIRIFGKRPIERLKDLGILNNNFNAVHAVHLSDKEIRMLANNNSKVVHNPSANMKLADGVCNVQKLIENDICVSLGTDSPASNDNLNLFEEMKITSLLQKVININAGIMNAQTTFDMATINASKVCNNNLIGTIECGKNADMVFIDINSLSINPFLSSSNILQNLIYGFNGSVSDVIIGGKFIMEERNFTTIDRYKIFNKLRKLIEQLDDIYCVK